MKHWLDRSLIVSPIYYCLLTSEKMLKKELKRLKIQDFDGISDGAGATTHFIRGPKAPVCALVCIFDKNHDKKQIYSLLSHEAVHIFQEIKKEIGESNPSPEFEAYSIQRISQNLFYEYDRQVKKK